jgi:transcription-repair coupling factor (superfamily II helicase)
MPQTDKYKAQLMRRLDEGRREIPLTGLPGSSGAFFLSRVIRDLDRPCLIVLDKAKEAGRFYRELAFFLPEVHVNGPLGERRLYDFPIYDISPLTGLSPHRDIITRRLQSLYVLLSEERPVVVTSVDATLLKIMPKESLIDALEYLEAGEELDREPFIAKMEANGYRRTSLVEERGDYSVRGGVIDLYPPLYSDPVRLEFWGDRMESIRHFDSLSQRSTDHLREVVISPAGEVLWGTDNVLRARSMGRLPGSMEDGGGFPGQEAWLNHVYARLGHLSDYFPKNGLLILMDPDRIAAEEERFFTHFLKDTERFGLEAEERERPFPETEGIILTPTSWESHFEAYQRITMSPLPIESRNGHEVVIHVESALRVEDSFDLQIEGKGRVSMAPLADRISQWLEYGSRVILVCRTEQQAHRLRDILRNYHVTVKEVVSGWEGISPGHGLIICLGRLSKGFSWPELGLYVVSEDEIFGPKRSRAKTTPGRKVLNWTPFSQLKEGDFLVHEDHGIGQYGGLCKMEIEKKINDFVIIEYADSDRLYVPADRISILQKYVGADERGPKLDQLGGRSWNVAKQKAKKSIREIAKQLVEIYALRNYRKGFSFSPPDHFFQEFEATFEHEETSDQIRAIDEVLADMESEKPMDRLICGDVGFGKTEVAIRASFKSVMDGKQVAMLVPTTVLAEQHYDNFSKRMAPYHIRVGVLSRFKTRKEQNEILAKVRSKDIDILIGTHRILQRDVAFNDLGLLIVDEEQRFGVKQKEALKRYRALVDVLALTATPIPRTLHMSLMGVRDLSIIETPPEDRLAIQTHLSHLDESTIRHAIEAELERGGQVFFVHNRVQTIEGMKDLLATWVPKARFAIAHGQMKERELEGTMIRFIKKEIDVLVCTTIIESGLDIPSANTIIINEVDRLGLAQIYQLRGRVGRSTESAYAYLLLSRNSNLTREAEKRLRALMDFSQLGAGIHLAMHDLKIRGGGNILGFSQSGHISAIGYELYLRLIEQAIAELKGEDWHEEINPEINVDMAAYIPNDYVSDTDVRLNLYRRMSTLTQKDELESIMEEINDRFGNPPPEVLNLFQIMSVRLKLKKIRASRLDVGKDRLILTFASDTTVDPSWLTDLISREPGRFQFLSENKVMVRTPPAKPQEMIKELEVVYDRLSLRLDR